MPLGLSIAIAVVSGAAAGVLGAARPATAFALGLACGSVALVVDRAGLRRALVLGAIVAASAVHGARARDRALAPPLGAWLDAHAPNGRLEDAVVIDATLAADAVLTDTGVRLLMDVRAVQEAGGWRRAPGRVQAHVAGDLAGQHLADWTAGRPIRAPMALRRPQIWLNPGGPNAAWQQLRQPFDLAGSIKSAALVSCVPGPWWDEAAASVRRYVRTMSARHLAPRDPESAAIVTAILIGDRAGLGATVEHRLQVAGTYHVIAISGGNVALIAMLCFWLLRVVVRSPRTGSMATMVVLVAYGAIVGGDASVARAVTGACVYLAVGLAGLRPRAVNVLAVVAMLLAAATPLVVIDVGAWLSFGATLGIILAAGRFARWTQSAGGARVSRREGGPTTESRGGHVTRMVKSTARSLVNLAIGLFAATLAAEVALVPISASVFFRVSVAGLVLNFVAIPAMAVVQIAGLALMAVAPWWRAGAAAAAWVAHLAARVLVGSADLVEVAPWLAWRVPPPAPVWTAAFYAALAVAWWARTRPVRFVAAAVAACSAGVILTAPGIELARPRAGWLRLTVLDVGQGDAILLQFPSGHALLVDAGGTSGTFDLGGRIVMPALWASGVRRLDWLAVTHPDRDHIGGALAVAGDLAPREIWEGVPVPPNPERAALRSAAQARAIVWRQLLAGHAFEIGGVVVDTRNPPPPGWERQRVRNDDSLVLRVRLGDVEVWLTGDAGQEFERGAQADWESEAPRAPIRVLKVGHHGSLTSSSTGFLHALAPTVALISVGRGNLFSHPAPEVLSRLARVGSETFRTDLDGAIVLETDGREVDIRTMGGRTWTGRVERK
jgi:competence protein ComEC